MAADASDDEERYRCQPHRKVSEMVLAACHSGMCPDGDHAVIGHREHRWLNAAAHGETPDRGNRTNVPETRVLEYRNGRYGLPRAFAWKTQERVT